MRTGVAWRKQPQPRYRHQVSLNAWGVWKSSNDGISTLVSSNKLVRAILIIFIAETLERERTPHSSAYKSRLTGDHSSFVTPRVELQNLGIILIYIIYAICIKLLIL